MAPNGIKPATLRFVAQHLNHCAIAVPHICMLCVCMYIYIYIYIYIVGYVRTNVIGSKISFVTASLRSSLH